MNRLIGALLLIFVFALSAYGQETNKGMSEQEDCGRVSQPISNAYMCLQSTTVNGRTAGHVYVWRGAISGWVDVSSGSTFPGTLSIASGKTATISNTLTFTGTDSSSVAFGAGGTVLYSGGALGTPSSGTATNLTGLPIAGITGLGTGVGTALAVNIGSAGAFVAFNGAGGTPSSLTLTNATGLPPAGVTGTAAILGANSFTGVQTFTANVLTKIPWANVKAFGATGDGATDDTTAVQAALTASRNVYLPAGTYIVSNLTVALDGTRIYGDGPSSILRFKAGSTGAMLTTGAHSIDMSNLAMYGGDDTSKKAVTTSTANRSAIDIKSQLNHFISKVTIHGFENFGILYTDVARDLLNHLVLTDSTIYNCYSAIKAGDNYGEYTKFANLHIHNNYYGLYLSSGNLIGSNLFVTENGFGVYVLGTGISNNAHGVISGSHIAHNTEPIHVEGVTLGFTFSGNNIFIGNLVIKDSSGVNISGGSLSVDGIYLSGGGLNYIQNNYAPTFYSNTIFHDYLLSLDSTRIVNNFQPDGTFLDNASFVASRLSEGLTYSPGAALTMSKLGALQNIIPIMTSDTAPSGTVTYSSYLSSNPVFKGWKAFDHVTTDPNSSWATNSTTTGWIVYQFPVAKTVLAYAISSVGKTGGDTWAPNAWTFDGSNDGSSWTTLDTRTGITSWGTTGLTRYYDIPTANWGSYTYYRLNITAINGGTVISIAEIQMFDLNSQVRFQDAAAAADQKTWGLGTANGVFNINSVTDAGVETTRVSVGAAGEVSMTTLTSTGSATGKKVVCVDTSTGRLYASSTGTDCSN